MRLQYLAMLRQRMLFNGESEDRTKRLANLRKNIFESMRCGVKLPVECLFNNESLLFCDFDYFLGFLCVARKRLLEQNMLSLLESFDRPLSMQAVG